MSMAEEENIRLSRIVYAYLEGSLSKENRRQCITQVKTHVLNDMKQYPRWCYVTGDIRKLLYLRTRKETRDFVRMMMQKLVKEDRVVPAEKRNVHGRCSWQLAKSARN